METRQRMAKATKKTTQEATQETAGRKSITNTELDSWADKQRKLYRAGKLSQETIKLLESTPGWTWAAKAPVTKAALRHTKTFIKHLTVLKQAREQRERKAAKNAKPQYEVFHEKPTTKPAVLGREVTHGQKIGAANDPNAPIYEGYVLRAWLTLDRRRHKRFPGFGRKTLAVRTFPLTSSGKYDRDPFALASIENPNVVLNAWAELKAKAKELGYHVEQTHDCTISPVMVITHGTLSLRKIA